MTVRGTLDYLVKRVAQLEREVRDRGLRERDLQREVERYRSLYQVAYSLGRGGKLAELAQSIADGAAVLCGAHGSCICLFDRTRDGDIEVTCCSGELTSGLKGMRFGSDRLHEFPDAGKGRIFEDCCGDGDSDPVVEQVCQTSPVLSAMVAPIEVEGRIFGFLYAFSRTDPFAQSDFDWLPLLADLAAAAIHRSETEQSLRESAERFRFMAETTGDVIYRLRYDSMRYDYLSPGISKLTGFTPDDIQNMGFGSLVMRIDTPREKNVSTRSIVKERLEGKTGEYRADYLIRTQSGASRWVRDHSFPWYDESGKVIGSVGILSDINEYKRVEARIEQRTQELIESEEKYRSLVENVPLVVYRMRPGEDIFFLNQFVEQLFGFSSDELLRNPALWAERVHDEDRRRVLDLRQKSCEEGTELLAEYRIVHKSGQIVYVLDHAIPFRSVEGSITSLDGIIMDMTGRVKLQEQLLRAEGLKTISEVSQRLAHEIRNPLVSAGGFARLLLSAMNQDDPNREKVLIIVQEVARLEAILRSIIKYLEPFELNRSLVDLDALVRSVLEEICSEIERKHIRLDFRPSVQPTLVPADPTLLEQALAAILKNAVDQVPSQGALTLSLASGAELAQISVTYQVRHLAGDDVEHFFYPFTTSQTSQLGAADLPMSKIIVAKHGGQIEVSSAGSNQVVVTISLPVRSSR